MISSLFTNPLSFILSLIALTIALTVHEFSHAWTSDHLGDPTARLQGRLTLNPLVHFDKLGLIFLLFFGFGWGKPVMFDPYNLKNPRKDAALISLAGPMSNLIIALICSIFVRLIILIKLPILLTLGLIIFLPIINMNIALGVFNLLPIHPLDGFKIFGGILSEEKAREWYQLEKFGMIFLLLLVIPIAGSPLLYTIMNPIINFFHNILLPSIKLGGAII